MVLKRNTLLLVFVLYSITLWCKSASAGSSFLSPSQKPQNKIKSYRAGRQVMKEPSPPTEDNRITISAPFELGISMSDEDLEEYVMELQEIVQRLLEHVDSTERPSHL